MVKKRRKPRRDKLEVWIDKHNHKLELLRTIGNLVSGIAGAIAILRVMGII